MRYYSVRHLTTFHYKRPVSESVMEVRMHPRTDTVQRCLSFSLSVNPRCRVFSYRDHLGNHVHHFDVPGEHSQLVLIAETFLELQALPEIPVALDASAWNELDAAIAQGDYSEMLMPSEFAKPSPLLLHLASQFDVRRRGDPLQLLREINSALYDWLDYAPKSTRVDSPIDEALEMRQGVCQDFAHTMIALVRFAGIPCRYVSGYLYHGEHDDVIRSTPAASHAWVEAFLPSLGWVGFDPTNNLIVRGHHLRTAIGRDYADVPPTRGVYRGKAEGELQVAVEVSNLSEPPALDRVIPIPEEWTRLVERSQERMTDALAPIHVQQMQQQQSSFRPQGFSLSYPDRNHPGTFKPLGTQLDARK